MAAIARDQIDVAVIGGGAAGIAAARRLAAASISCLIIEARPRLGGRAWTVIDPSGFAIDLGCGWLHSADRNPWAQVAAEQGATIDKSLPAWRRPPLKTNFPEAQFRDFQSALSGFYERLDGAGDKPGDSAAAALLDPASRWNPLINALSSYISGVELDQVSAKDLDRYADTGINWRIVQGLGATIRAYGASAPAVLDCPVTAIDHRARQLVIETAKGNFAADQAIVAIPSAVLATGAVAFTPALPAKIEAAQHLPLGTNNLFIALDRAEEFDSDIRVFGHTDRTATAGYNFRPMGRPQIEAYFGGRLAADLEAEGEKAFFDFAVSELAGLFGSGFAARLKPIGVHCWGRDPFAQGAYSLPGGAESRQVLAEPVDSRLFFAGEACSRHDFSTAHGAWHTGVAAADAVIAARRAKR
jgi:monoamine oxidase